MPASMSSGVPTPSATAKAASLTSWQTMRPRTSPGASSTHSAWRPSRAKNPSGASAANDWGPGAGEEPLGGLGGERLGAVAAGQLHEPGLVKRRQQVEADRARLAARGKAAGRADREHRRSAGHRPSGLEASVHNQLGRPALAQLVARGARPL